MPSDIEYLREYHGEIIESLPSTVIILNRVGEILYANRNFYIASRKKKKDVLGRKIGEVFPSDIMRRTKLDEHIKEVFRTGTSFEGKNLRYRQEFYFYSIRPLMDEYGETGRVMFLMEDITSLTDLETKLKESHIRLENAYAELKDLDKAKSEFISLISHEMRTPLTVLSSYIELMLSGKLGKLTKKQRSKIDILAAETKTMIEMIESMLDVSKVESRLFEIAQEPLSLPEVVESSIKKIRGMAELKNQAISVEIPDNLPNITGDKEGIERIFTNLLSNAVKYTEENGNITVELRSGGKNVHITVADTGIGIPKKERTRIFQKFYVGDASSLTREPGKLGLGLPIAKGIVEKHNGKIWVESKVGKGSTFHVTLPYNLEGRESTLR